MVKKSTPFVSVIVPVYNDAEGIADTLQSLAQQDYNTDRWEVIVVDNNSTDDTVKVAHSFQKEFNLLSVMHESKQSSYAARNKGILNSIGTIIAFIDTDMTVQSDWISVGVTDLVNNYADYIGCRVDIYTQNPNPTIWETYNIINGFPIKKYMEQYGFAGAGNLFVKKEVFDRVDGFDQRVSSGGDLEFGNRVKDAGLKMYYSEHNVMKHPARSSMKSLFKKAVRVANGHADLSIYYPERYGKQLTFLPVLFCFIPIFLIPTKFNTLDTVNQIQMLAIANYIKFIGACTLLIRYFKKKL